MNRVSVQKAKFLKFLLLALLMGLGFLGNVFKVTLFYNVDLIFGSFFVMIIVSLYGPVWGTIAGAAAASYTYVLWNHPYAIIIFTCEAAFVAFLYRRRKVNLVLIDIAYWFVLGMPLVYLFYHGIMGMNNTGALLIMFKQAVNGIFNALIARLVLMLLRRKWAKVFSLSWSGKWEFSNVLFNLIMAFVLLPSLFFTSFSGRLELRDIDSEIDSQLRFRSGTMEQVINSRIGRDRIRIEQYAELVSRIMENGGSAEEAGGVLTEVKKGNDRFLGFCITDRNSEVLFYAGFGREIPAALQDRVRRAVEGITAEQANAKEARVVSLGPASGDEGANAPLLFCASIRNRDGEYTGILGAVMLSDDVFHFVEDILVESRTEAALVAADGALVFQTAEDEDRIGRILADIHREGGEEEFHWMPPAKRNISVMERWRETVHVRRNEIAELPGWELFSFASVAPFQERVYRDSFSKLLIIVLLIFITALVSRIISARYVLPIRRLEHISTNLPQKLLEGGRPAWPRTILKEIAGLVQNYRLMANSLKRTFRELRQANADLLKEKERAEAANLAKTKFIANMSHDIRTPMTAIKGMAEILLEEEDLPLEQKEHIRTIEESSTVLLGILNNILDLSKIESGKLNIETVDFDIRETVDRIVRMFRPGASMKGLELRSSVGKKIPSYLQGDPLRIQQVLMNIVGNALKFTEKGRISVELKLEEDLPVQLPKDRRNSSYIPVTFYVFDTGIGIPSEKREVIFESFTQADYSTTRKYGGSGLGLTISRELVSLMGGNIFFKSTPEKGSVFYFTLPLKTARENSARVLSAPEEASEPGIERENTAFPQPVSPRPVSILVADDDRINRKITVRKLEKAGYHAVSVSDGKEVIAKLKTASFDLVFLDINMPVMGGVEAARKIRSGEAKVRDREIPIVALTAGALEQDIQIWREAGINDYLEKPLTIKKVEELAAKYIQAE